jgi:hypothetical protein
MTMPVLSALIGPAGPILIGFTGVTVIGTIQLDDAKNDPTNANERKRS